ncbi:eukaryotic translation initiation factor 2-alpha kinase 1 isoform X1 [Lampetra fluviatilis]
MTSPQLAARMADSLAGVLGKASIEFKAGHGEEIQRFDDSDCPMTEAPAEPVEDGALSPRGLRHSVSNQLLLVTLLEHLCSLYERDPINKQALFHAIGAHLIQLKLVSPSSFCDEFATVRNQYSKALCDLLRSGSSHLHTELSLFPEDCPRPLALPSRQKEQAFHTHTSRYLSEFEEVCRLGRGGYGQVFKVRNKLDRQLYAVKKVLIKGSGESICKKVLREVKLLAGLQHLSIVGYHGAWLELLQPPTLAGCLTASSSAYLMAVSGPLDSASESEAKIMNASSDSIIFQNASQSSEKQTTDTPPAIAPDPTLQHPPEHVKQVENKETLNHKDLNQNCVELLASRSLPSAEAGCQRNVGWCPPGRFSSCHVPSLVQAHGGLNSESHNNSGSNKNGKNKNEHSGRKNEHSGSNGKPTNLRKELYESNSKLVGSNNELSESSSEQSENSNTSWTPGSDSKDGSSWREMACMKRDLHLVLYIQMQLCERSLKEWLMDRNALCERFQDSAEGATALSGRYALVDGKQTTRMFQQLLEGVHYIHSRGIMHRDLKPRNIFLHGPDHHVRIGDFGLACQDIVYEDPRLMRAGAGDAGGAHTSGVGTTLYAAPEQLSGSHYDFKSDMYSVGIVLFELFQPFGTEMERVQTIQELRGGVVSGPFTAQWPEQAKYIGLLTQDDPAARPTPQDILTTDLIVNKDQVIVSLQRQLSQKDEELARLKALLQNREETIRWQERSIVMLKHGLIFAKNLKS